MSDADQAEPRLDIHWELRDVEDPESSGFLDVVRSLQDLSKDRGHWGRAEGQQNGTPDLIVQVGGEPEFHEFPVFHLGFNPQGGWWISRTTPRGDEKILESGITAASLKDVSEAFEHWLIEWERWWRDSESGSIATSPEILVRAIEVFLAAWREHADELELVAEDRLQADAIVDMAEAMAKTTGPPPDVLKPALRWLRKKVDLAINAAAIASGTVIGTAAGAGVVTELKGHGNLLRDLIDRTLRVI